MGKVDGKYTLKKFPGKGGWTYTEIPEIAQNPSNHFGWVTVSGTIDGYPLKHHKLMPMGNGQLFLSVKASIRKHIGKQAEDTVHIILEEDLTNFECPSYIKECFQGNSDPLFKKLMTLSSSQRKQYIAWIEEARSDEGKANRIAKMMQELAE